MSLWWPSAQSLAESFTQAVACSPEIRDCSRWKNDRLNSSDTLNDSLGCEMRVECSLRSTDESKRTYKTSAIHRAIELVTKAKDLVRELRASTRETKRSRRLSKIWRVASRKAERGAGG